MFGKPSITVLQEYCAKNHLDLPQYDEMDDVADKEGKKMFVFRINALGVTCQGIGRSKKDAKHDAAHNLINRMRQIHPGLDDIPQAEMPSISTSTDAVKALRDLCVQRGHPLPLFELVQQAGPPESPQYTFQCTVGNIIRMSTAMTKKMAKQLAAQQLVDIVQSLKQSEQNPESLQITTIDAAAEGQSDDNYLKFKSYRELTESDVKLAYKGNQFCERFLYFKHFFNERKYKAYMVLRSKDYHSDQDKVVDLMKALNLKYRVNTINMANLQIHTVFEVICETDVVFINTKEKIYKEILEYFTEML